MSLVFAGVCSHAPGITGRKDRADPDGSRRLLCGIRPHARSARSRAARCAGRHRRRALRQLLHEQHAGDLRRHGRHYEGPIEDEAWLGIKRSRVPARRICRSASSRSVMQDVDLAYAQEWKFDHGIMVPLHFLTPRYDLPVIPVNINCQGPPLIPLQRCYEFGRALRRACDAVPERIAVIGTGGISHWPATPDSGKINEPGTGSSSSASSRTAATSCSPTGRGDLARGRAGRLRDSHLHRRRRGDGRSHAASCGSTRRSRSSRSAARSR